MTRFPVSALEMDLIPADDRGLDLIFPDVSDLDFKSFTLGEWESEFLDVTDDLGVCLLPENMSSSGHPPTR